MPSDPGIPPGPIAILLVEDEADVRQLVTWQLRGMGYDVVEAGSATEALHILSIKDDFDLLFTDVVLSDAISGLELARRVLRAFGSRTKVLLTSGYLKEDLFQEYGLPGREMPLLPKPYTREQLAAAIQGVIGTKG